MNQFTPIGGGAGEEGQQEEPQRLSPPGHLLKGNKDRDSIEVGQAGVSEALLSGPQGWFWGALDLSLLQRIGFECREAANTVTFLPEPGSQSKRSGPLLT